MIAEKNIEKLNKKGVGQIEEDMKQIIRYSHLETLTQEADKSRGSADCLW